MFLSTENKDLYSFSFDSYEYVVPDDRQFGVKAANGSWTGIIGLLMRNVSLEGDIKN